MKPSRKSQQQTKKTALAALEDSIAGAVCFDKIAKRDNDALKREKCNGHIVKREVSDYSMGTIGGVKR